MKEKNIRELAKRMGLITVENMCQYTIAQLVYMIANKMNELIDGVGQFESDVTEIVKSQNEKIQHLLGEGLLLDVENIFDGWVKDGTFDTLLNNSALKSVNERIDETNAQLSNVDNEIGQIQNKLKGDICSYYSYDSTFIDNPKSGYTVAGDIAFADDRNGSTGKIWAFYFYGDDGLVRSEIPYFGCNSDEIGNRVKPRNIDGRINNFINFRGIWYCGVGNKIMRFMNGIDGEASGVVTLGVVGEDGNSNFCENACINYEENPEKWVAWYSTFNATTGQQGIRRCTSNTNVGPWTKESGFWLLPSDINEELNWLRIYYTMTDNFGQKWAIAGCGRRWGGTSAPHKDNGAEVWVAKINSYLDKPKKSDWKRLVAPPYFTGDNAPLGSKLINNAYAPSLVNDGKQWFMYVNTGVYGQEKIVCLKQKGGEYWVRNNNLGEDIILSKTFAYNDYWRAYLTKGKFKINIEGIAINNTANSEPCTINIKIVNMKTKETLASTFFRNGDVAWETKQFSLSTIINANWNDWIAVQYNFSTIGAYAEPNDARLRSVSLSVESI